MSCQRCKSERVVFIQGKCSDLCFCTLIDDSGTRTDHDGYVPQDLGVGGGDCLEFDLCMDCGTVQGKFPLDPTALEIKRGSLELKE